MPSSRVTSEIRRLQLPADVGFTIVGANGQSGDLQQWNNNSGTVLARVTSAGLASFPNVAVTATTIPTNGIYLPAANTLGFATNSTVRMQINASGEVGIGAAPATGTGVRVAKNITGSTSAYGITQTGTVQSDVTGTAYSIYSGINTQATAFTLTSYINYIALQGTIGVGSTVTNQFGFAADGSLTGATNNYGFWSGIASGSNRWNFYASGTAANYFAGQTTVGSTSLTLGSSSVAQQFGVVSAAATNIGMVIRGATSQTGDLTQWQNSAGTNVATIDSAGRFTNVTTGNYALQIGSTDTAAIAYIKGASYGFRIGISATNGAILEGVDATNGVTSYQPIRIGGSILTLHTANTSRLSIDANGNVLVNGFTASTVGLTVKAASSQTANLTEWQNSSGTVLTAIGSGGALTIHGVTSTGATGTGKMVFDTTPTLVTPVIGAATGTSLAVTGALTSSSATSGIGYATGAGGTQTQSGGKTTGVTLNTITGQITMSTGNLTAGSITSFTLTNSAVATTDVVHVQHISGGTVGAYTCTAAPGNGSATIYVRNSSGSNLNEQPVLQFVVIKAVTA